MKEITLNLSEYEASIVEGALRDATDAREAEGYHADADKARELADEVQAYIKGAGFGQ